MSMQLVIYSSVLLVCGLFSSLKASQFEVSADNDFDEYVKDSMNTWSVPGMALGIIKDGQIVLSRGYGVKDLGTSDPVDEETLFPIASLTKAFTAALAGMLVDEGKVDWDDPVIQHLPNFQLYDPYLTREITIRDLLSHRSGLERAEHLWYLTSYDKNEVIHRLRFLKPKWSMRSHFTYNNILYSAVGLLEEAVSGVTWETLIHKRIFEPLGMKSSLTNIEDASASRNIASAYTMHNNQITPIDWLKYDNCRAAIGICSNVVDLLKWVSLHMQKGDFDHRQILRSDTVEEIHSPQMVIHNRIWRDEYFPGSSFLSYGFGWFVHEYQGRTVIEHTGSVNGATALIAMVPEDNLGIVVLINRDSGALFPAVIKNRLFDAYFGKPSIDWNLKFFELHTRHQDQRRKEESADKSERIVGSTPSLPLKQYAGIYEDPLYGRIQINLVNGALHLQSCTFNGQMEHWHFDTFKLLPRCEPSPIGETFYITFALDYHGHVEGMKINTPSPKGVSFTKLDIEKS